jgi:hypothetical protein
VLHNVDEQQHVFFSKWPEIDNIAVNKSMTMGSNDTGRNGGEEDVNYDASPEHVLKFTTGERRGQAQECEITDGDKNNSGALTNETPTRSQTVVVTTTVFHPREDVYPTENGPASDASSVPTISVHSPLPTRSIIFVKPLIVLDLNVILCHSVRERHTQSFSLMESPISSHHNNSRHNGTVSQRTILRKSAARIANTEIIPRSDLSEFLHLLHQNFALAVWTSATYKTAKLLVRLLFPDHIRSRLVFVWHRSFCNLVRSSELKSCTDDEGGNHHNTKGDDGGNGKKRTKKNCGVSVQVSEVNAVDNTIQDGPVRDVHEVDSTKLASTNQLESYQEVTAIKSLSKVWSAYPLWDDSNTLLIDDSPEKCPKRFRRNAIHPPPLCGTETFYSDVASHSLGFKKEDKVDDENHEASDATSSKDPSTLFIFDDDEPNQKLQRQFFELLARHWSCPQPRNIDTICSSRQKLNQFLKENATSHNMRWKVG